MEDGKEQERPSANAPADSEKSEPSSQEEVAYDLPNSFACSNSRGLTLSCARFTVVVRF